MEPTLEQRQEEIFEEIIQKIRARQSKFAMAKTQRINLEKIAAGIGSINRYSNEKRCEELINQIEQERKYAKTRINLTSYQKRNAFLVTATLAAGAAVYLALSYLM